MLSIKSKLFSIPSFDAETESLFWCERQEELHKTLKTALLLGSSVFLVFICVKVLNHQLSMSALPERLMIVLALAGLYLFLHVQRPPIQQVRNLAKLAVILTSINIVTNLLIDASPTEYAEFRAGFLALYFFTYGQLFLSRAEALAFGWVSLCVITVGGYWVGVTVPELMTSFLIMMIVNIFGSCTRCQLERYSRNAFMGRHNAETATADKTLYLCQLSHNLRQLVQTISCYSSVLDNEIAHTDSPGLLNTSSKLGNAVDELNSALNHILDLAHLETGKQVPHLTVVEINLVLDALETQFKPLAINKGLRLKIHRRDHPPYFVHTDASILQQILANLIDNAIKYTYKGWVLVACVKTGSMRLNVHVRDSGIGIGEELHGKIFKGFCRGGSRRGDADVSGLGIGLAYALKATQHLLEHRLLYHSRPSKGSDFIVTVPVWQLKAASNTEIRQHFDFSNCFVLIVDDDVAVLKALTEQLQSWGCIVESATSTTETRDCLTESVRHPDILITDYYLENQETAYDIITCIQSHCGAVPTLVLSAHAIPAADKVKWPENIKLLRKPANAGDLMERMAEAMGKRNIQLPTSGRPNTIPCPNTLTSNSDLLTTPNFWNIGRK